MAASFWDPGRYCSRDYPAEKWDIMNGFYDFILKNTLIGLLIASALYLWTQSDVGLQLGVVVGIVLILIVIGLIKKGEL